MLTDSIFRVFSRVSRAINCRRRFSVIALALAIAAGMFLLLTGGLLLFNQAQGKVAGLVQSRELSRLHDDLRQRPKDESLKQRIRQLDLQLRQNTFYQLRLSHNGARAMIAGLVLFLGSAHLVRSLRRKLPDPVAWGPRVPAEGPRARRLAGYAVAAVFGMIAAAALSATLNPVRLPVPAAASGTAAAEPPPVTYPSLAEMQQNWPAFRGADGSGSQTSANPPQHWNVQTGAGIRWQTVIPLPGMSSPIRWENDLFLTGASAQEDRVFKFDADTGKLVWSVAVRVTEPPGPGPKVSDDTGLAAPTPVTDGRRVYAMFANAVVAAVDGTGKQLWARALGPLDNAYGHASSLAIFQDRLLVQLDQSEDRSALIALNTRTGQELWRVARPVTGSWASPIIVAVDGQPQLITCAEPWVIAYNPASGSELWRVNGLGSDLAPSPILAGGLVIACSPHAVVLAIRPNGHGDVTATNVAWKSEDGVPSVSSPVSDGTRLYLLTSEGLLTCVDLPTGKVKWTHEFDEEFYASPTLAGQTLVLLSRKGVAYVVATGDQYRELGKNELGEECNASPVPHGARLYIRGTKHLFCIEGGGTTARAAEARASRISSYSPRIPRYNPGTIKQVLSFRACEESLESSGPEIRDSSQARNDKAIELSLQTRSEVADAL